MSLIIVALAKKLQNIRELIIILYELLNVSIINEEIARIIRR